MIEIVDAIQRRKSAETEVPVCPKHGKLRSPIGRQRCRLASNAVKHPRAQARLCNQSDIDVAVARAESAMGEATHEINSEQFVSELSLAKLNKATGKI